MRPSGKTVCCLVLFSSFSSLLASSQGNSREINVCSEEHKFRCEAGELISLDDVVCGNGNMCSSSTNKTLFDLCQGQQTCSSLDLGLMFSAVCGNDEALTHSPRVKFKCVPGSTSSCRSNICSDSSLGLNCPSGSFVHIWGVACGSPSRPCSRSVYANLFLCEGVGRCAASGLKTMLSQSCQHRSPENGSVIVQYFCVPEHQLESRCSSVKYRNLDREFGVLKSPKIDPASRNINAACKWVINPIGHNKVKVTVHLVNTKITRSECDPDVLNITFTDCSSSSVITRSFCIVDNASVDITSCGQVKILSAVPRGEESSDEFIVSYQRYQSDVTTTLPSGLPICVAPPATNPTREPAQAKTSAQPVSRIKPGSKTPEQPKNSKTSFQPSSKTSPKSPATITRNYGPGDGIFEYRDSMFDEDAGSTNNNGESSTLSRHLKLMILYIFFGVVILVLAVALIAVLISYYRISNLKDPRGDSSEKTALCQHHEDTPLDTFQNHTLAESSDTPTPEITYVFGADHDNEQVVATVHHDAVYDQGDFDPRLSNGSGISTFLAGKRDTDFRDLINTFQTGTFPLYSSLGEGPSTEHIDMRQSGYYEIGDTGHHETPSDQDFGGIYEVIDQDNHQNGNQAHLFSHGSYPPSNESGYHVMKNHVQQPLDDLQHPSNDYHYLINNDEYAIVCKSRKPARSSNITNGCNDQQFL